jgi:hypothetical protein
VDVGSQQRTVTTGILDRLQAPVDKADYMGHCFKGSTAQVHCRAEQRSSSRAQGLVPPHSPSRGRHMRVQELM